MSTLTSLLRQLVAKHVQDLVPYASARRLFSSARQSTDKSAPVWLNANEAPVAGDYQIDSGLYNRYPDCQPDALIAGYADYAGVQAAQVLATRGADEGIELLIRTFCNAPDDHILICPPTYGMYAISAATANIGVHHAPLKDDFSLDIDAIKAFKGHTNLVFLCSPNNPTGNQLALNYVVSIVEHFADSALVVIDEAYVEFASYNTTRLLADYPHVVILRTLSKAFGLAGLRCGFTLAQPEVIEQLLKVIAPYPISAPVADIAIQALSASGLATMQTQVSTLQAEQAHLIEVLPSIGDIELVGQQDANFVLFRTAQKDALMQYLVHQQVFIRDQSKQLKLAQCLRISVGTAQQNARLISLIQQFYAIQEATAL